MKIGGMILFLIAVWWTYLWRYDSCEGPFMRAVGVIAAAGGFFMFVEGIKREIIEAIQEKNRSGSQYPSKTGEE